MAYVGRCVLLFLCIASMSAAADHAKTIHVFVALCDNEHQGIGKSPRKSATATIRPITSTGATARG